MITSIKIKGAMPRKTIANVIVGELKSAFVLFITSVRTTVFKGDLTLIYKDLFKRIEAIKAQLPEDLDISYDIVENENVVKVTTKLTHTKPTPFFNGKITKIERKLKTQKIFEITINL